MSLASGTQYRVERLKFSLKSGEPSKQDSKQIFATFPDNVKIPIRFGAEYTPPGIHPFNVVSGRFKVEVTGVKRNMIKDIVSKTLIFDFKLPPPPATQIQAECKEYFMELTIVKVDKSKTNPAFASPITSSDASVPVNLNPLAASSSAAAVGGGGYGYGDAAQAAYPSFTPYPMDVQAQMAAMQFSQPQSQPSAPSAYPQGFGYQPAYGQQPVAQQAYGYPPQSQPQSQPQFQPQPQAYGGYPGQQPQMQPQMQPLPPTPQPAAHTPTSDPKRIQKVMINRSEIMFEKKIGSGAFGEVWKGKWQYRDVAIKKIQSTQITKEEMDDFLQEIHAMRKLKHPNILISWGAITEGECCLITEYMDKGSLFHVIGDASSPFHNDWTLRSHIALSAAIGLNYLHSRVPPIIHRDVKSLNILVNKHWEAKLADFGLTRQKASASMSTKCGSPHWSAPEVLNSEPYNEKADIYSFGILLWEIIADSPPYKGLDAVQVITKVIRGERPPIPQVPQQSPFKEMVDLMVACWQANPHHRPTSTVVVERLQSIHASFEERFPSPVLNPSAVSAPSSSSSSSSPNSSCGSPQIPQQGGQMQQSPLYAQPINAFSPQSQPQQSPQPQQFPLYAQPQFGSPQYPPQAYYQQQQQQMMMQQQQQQQMMQQQQQQQMMMQQQQQQMMQQQRQGSPLTISGGSATFGSDFSGANPNPLSRTTN